MLHLVGSRDIYLIHFVQSDKAALLICIMYNVFLFTLDAAHPPPPPPLVGFRNIFFIYQVWSSAWRFSIWEGW